MPYLTAPEKLRLDHGTIISNPGELTYKLTTAVLHNPDSKAGQTAHIMTAINRYLANKPARFATYAEVLGCLTAAAHEIHRRTGRNVEQLLFASDDFYAEVVAPYEDEKIKENGDVFDD